jgi:hypothetical protein
MRQCLLLAATVLTVAGVLNGASLPIPIRNFSFEQPGTGKTNMSGVPGWRFDGAGTPLAGVETGYEPSDGFWTAYIEGGAAGTPIWQLIDCVIGEGDVFELKVDARITWAASTMEMTLFYDGNGTRIVVASQHVMLTNSMAEYTLPFSAAKMPMSAGHRIGVLFVNTSPASTWIGIDNVRLTRVAAGTPTLAARPQPADRTTETPRNIELGWTPGEFAVSHDVYLGTDFNAVSNAGKDDPLGVLAAQGVTAGSFNPGRLQFGRTYYWRVDEVNAHPSSSVFKGNVWSFTVEPLACRIENVTATASSAAPSSSARNTANGSGLDADDRHSAYTAEMWLTAKNSPKSAWIQYDFGRLCKVHEMRIWNYNGRFEDMLGFGVKDASIEYSADGTSWTTLGQFQLARGPGEPGYACDNTIPFGDVAARWVRITVHSGWGVSGQFGLSEVRFFHIPAFAREPRPAPGDREVAADSTLSWRPGREALAHRVHISTDANTVANGTALTDTITDSTYSPANLSLGTKYYWRVDEVNAAEATRAWAGDTWDFTTTGYRVVDDMEDYTDNEGARLFDSWVDGWCTTTNGSRVGSRQAPFTERAIRHGGRQSMPFVYNNSGSTTNAEATRTFNAVQDWTRNGAKALVLFFRGEPANVTTVPMWIKLTDAGGNTAKVVYGSAAGEDVTALAEPAWTQWNIPLSRFAGVSLSRVASITIGFGSGTGSGRLFFDDIRLCPGACAVAAPALAGWWKLDNNAQDSSGNGNHGTLGANPTWTTGRIGAALYLNGTDDHVDCGNGATLDITDRITVAAWIKPNDVGNGEHNDFVGKGDHAYALKHNKNNTLEFFIYDGTWYSANSDVLTSGFNGTWHHVAGTYDGTQVRLYVDGKLVAGTLHAGAIASTTHRVNIGRNSERTVRQYNGVIDDVRIYRGALPTSEIVKLANP